MAPPATSAPSAPASPPEQRLVDPTGGAADERADDVVDQAVGAPVEQLPIATQQVERRRRRARRRDTGERHRPRRAAVGPTGANEPAQYGPPQRARHEHRHRRRDGVLHGRQPLGPIGPPANRRLRQQDARAVDVECRPRAVALTVATVHVRPHRQLDLRQVVVGPGGQHQPDVVPRLIDTSERPDRARATRHLSQPARRRRPVDPHPRVLLLEQPEDRHRTGTSCAADNVRSREYTSVLNTSARAAPAVTVRQPGHVIDATARHRPPAPPRERQDGQQRQAGRQRGVAGDDGPAGQSRSPAGQGVAATARRRGIPSLQRQQRAR